MPKRYSDEEKAEALRLLSANRYDVARTSLEIGIPERTLHRWRRNEQLDKRFMAADPPPMAAAIKDDDNDSDEDPGVILSQIHRRMLDDIVKLSGTIERDLETASPYQRLQALVMLIDRLDKIDRLIPRNLREMVISFEYVDPKDNPTY